MAHVVLLGDSIFDNGAYTSGRPDVAAHLRALLPQPWKVTLRAVDGTTTPRLRAQLGGMPNDASHLVVAIGGNDALQNSDLLSTPVVSSAETLWLFSDRLEAFAAAYGAAIDAVIALRLPTIVCTIYNGALDPEQAALARVGLMMFNDVILSTAVDRRLDVIELRAICNEPGDYANPIEPSDQGGYKIARAIARALGAVDDTKPPSRVWA